MDIFNILFLIVSGVYILGWLCIQSFFPFIFRYGITIFCTKIEKNTILDFSEKIGREIDKKNTRIKIYSKNEIFFLPNFTTAVEAKIFPYFINKCILYNGEYWVISKIPLSYFIFPVAIVMAYYLNIRDVIILLFSVFSSLFIISLVAHNWKMKLMLTDINDFLDGNEL